MKLPHLDRIDPTTVVRQFGTGRAVVGTGFLVAPVPSLRILGVDTATARRVAWLSRMMAVRDAALGVGAVVAERRGADTRAWLLAGAASDAVDAVAVAAAMRRGTLRGVAPAGLVAGAALAAAAGLATAARLPRR